MLFILERNRIISQKKCKIAMFGIRYNSLIRISIGFRYKHTIDYSKVPVLNESELEEQFVRGSGPGGQKTNKTANCVVLKHIPTGIVVKCHENRLQSQNRDRARELLVTRLDNLINGENSVEGQRKALQEKKNNTRQKKQEKMRQLKEDWKKKLLSSD